MTSHYGLWKFALPPKHGARQTSKTAWIMQRQSRKQQQFWSQSWEDFLFVAGIMFM